MTTPQKKARRASIPYRKDLALEYKKNNEGEDQSKVMENGAEKNTSKRQNLPVSVTEKIPSNVQNGAKQRSGGG